MSVSEIGFGGWGIGGVAPGTKSYGRVDDAVSLKALRHALDRGITFYDTADLYGLGHSEELIGQAFERDRAKVVICSKVGFTVDAAGNQAKDFSAAHVRRSIEGTLRRLRTDYLDLYLLHDPSTDLLKADPAAVETMRELKREGKVRAWGISLRSPADGAVAIGEYGAQAVQVNFNLIDQRAIDNGLLKLCEERGVGVIARTPLCFGFLTGRLTAETEFAVDDHRSGWPRKQIALWASAPGKFRDALGVDEEPGRTALRYCLTYPGISTVIPGMLNEAEVDENVAASEAGTLSAGQRAAAERVYRENVFFAR